MLDSLSKHKSIAGTKGTVNKKQESGIKKYAGNSTGQLTHLSKGHVSENKN